MTIDVEIRLVAMHPLANPVRQPTHSKNVARPVKRKCISLVQALAGENFILDRQQARIVGLE